MRLSEITQHPAQLFFGSRNEIPLGKKLLGRAIKHSEPEEKIVEKMLEMYRPAAALSRNKCVYMVDQPNEDLIERAGGYADFIYLVEPHGTVSKHDSHWWGEILSMCAYEYLDGERERSILEAKPLAENYWNGIASERPVWEYRAAAVTVMEQVEPT